MGVAEAPVDLPEVVSVIEENHVRTGPGWLVLRRAQPLEHEIEAAAVDVEIAPSLLVELHALRPKILQQRDDGGAKGQGADDLDQPQALRR